jgi:dienelactone hydrolase
MHRLSIVFATLALSACASNGDGEEAGTPASGPDIRGEEVTYESDGVTLRGYLAYDAGRAGPRPGVLVVHEWWGHNEYVRTRARMLAKLGYTALAVDMYGDGKQADNPKDASKLAGEVYANMEASTRRFAAAQKLLEDHATTDGSKTAAIGYCFGGSVVLHMARVGLDLDGVASFHGSLSTKAPAQAETVKAKVLVCHGADDPLVPAKDVEAFRQEMADAGVDLKFVAYPGAVHAFTNPGATALGEKFKLPVAYNSDADLASWAELQDFLTGLFGR